MFIYSEVGHFRKRFGIYTETPFFQGLHLSLIAAMFPSGSVTKCCRSCNHSRFRIHPEVKSLLVHELEGRKRCNFELTLAVLYADKVWSPQLFCTLKYFWDIFLTCKLGQEGQQRQRHMVTTYFSFVFFGLKFPPGAAKLFRLASYKVTIIDRV